MDDTRPDVLIGVDGGSTKTQCVVLSCSSLTSIAMVKGGGCNGYASSDCGTDEQPGRTKTLLNHVEIVKADKKLTRYWPSVLKPQCGKLA